MNGTPGVEGRVVEAGSRQGREEERMRKRLHSAFQGHWSGEPAPRNPRLYGLREAKG